MLHLKMVHAERKRKRLIQARLYTFLFLVWKWREGKATASRTQRKCVTFFQKNIRMPAQDASATDSLAAPRYHRAGSALRHEKAAHV